MRGIWTWLRRNLRAGTDASGQRRSPEASANCSLAPILSQEELAREVRALTAGGREPSVEELRALQDRFSRNLASEVPHFLGHWFADADIRRRDREYSRAQAAQLEATLRKMEGQRAT